MTSGSTFKNPILQTKKGMGAYKRVRSLDKSFGDAHISENTVIFLLIRERQNLRI